MELKYRLRPTMIHTNARFRGPTEALKYTNMINETVHDLILLSTVIDENREKGQSNYIAHNFSQYVNGEGNELHANIPAVTTLVQTLGEKIEDPNITVENWTAYGGCTIVGTSEQPALASEGKADPSGVFCYLDVEEGELVYIQAKVALLRGDDASFSIGSEDVNQGEGTYTRFTLPNPEAEGYIDAVIRCRHRERIKLNLDLFRGTRGQVEKRVAVSDLKILQLKEMDLKVEPINTSIKSRINKISEEIHNLNTTL